MLGKDKESCSTPVLAFMLMIALIPLNLAAKSHQKQWSTITQHIETIVSLLQDLRY